MPLSPADFYAYSRATGAPVADTPEDRAKQAPEVLAFQQNRLQAPKQGPGLLDFLGGAALLAGVGAGGYGIARAMRNRNLGQTAAKVAVEEITPQAVQNVRRVAAAAPIADPWGQGSVPQPPSSRYIPSAPWFTEAAVKPSTVDLNKQITTLVDFQNAQKPLHNNQIANAINAAEDQMTGRMKHALQQNPHLDMSQIEVLEDIAEHTYRLGMEQDEPINLAATQVIGHVPNDQAESAANFAQAAVQKQRESFSGLATPGSGFKAFSQKATRSENLRKLADAVWAQEELLEQLGAQSRAEQAARNVPKIYTAQDLTGLIKVPGRTKGISYAESALPSSYGLSHTEVRDRLMAAASASPEEAQLLLNPNVPTEKVRHLLGTTGGINPTMEMRTHGQMGPTDYESFATRRVEEQAGPEVAQKFLEQRLGTAGTVTGIREVNNPEYENLLFNHFIPHWDANSAEGYYSEGQLIKTNPKSGFLHPRNTTVTAEDVKRYGLDPERLHSNMSFMERKGLEQKINEDWDKAGTGLYLYEHGKALGMQDVPQTILQENLGQPLIETLGFKERTNTGTTFVPGEVQEVEGIPTASIRQERTKEGVLYPRSNLLGEQSTGVEVTANLENPFTLVTEPITSTKLIGGYEIPEATPHFLTGPAVAGKRPDIQISIKDNGQMVPVVKTQTEHFPVNRLDQIKYLPAEGAHQPGSQTVSIQPYMVGDLVEHEGQNFVVSKPIYGPLMKRTSEGLKPTTVDIAALQNAAEVASSKWNNLGQTKLDYLANTGDERDLNYLADHGYEVIEQRYRDGQTVNKAVAVRSDATDPNKLGEAYHHTGYVADQLHQHLLNTQGIDLPVLQDPSAKHQFVGDVTNVTAERNVYGSPYTGEIQKKVKDPLNYGRYGRTWVEGEGYATQQLPGRHRQLGLSGADPMQFEDAGEVVAEGTGVAFHTPRVQTTPARVTGDVPASRVLPSAIPLGQARSREDIENTLMNQAANRQEMMETARLTPGGRINPEALESETEVLNKYGISSARLIEQANTQMARSQQFLNQLPGARRALTAQQQTLTSDQERANAIAQHLANYISSAAQRVEGPMSWKSDVKLKGVGQNRLMPYASPSEGMIQALINKARNR